MPHASLAQRKAGVEKSCTDPVEEVREIKKGLRYLFGSSSRTTDSVGLPANSVNYK
jgi:hypothetical protein